MRPRRATSRASRGGSRRLRAFIADVGAGLPSLPWCTPTEAMRWLEPRDRATVERVRARIADSFLTDAPHLEVAAALGAVHDGQAVAVYPNAPPGGLTWVAQTFADRSRPSDAPIVNQDQLPEVRLYELDGQDPFAGRPVACAPLFDGATTGNDPLGFVERVLLPNGLRDQLRIVIYERGKAALFAGWYRPDRARRFDERDHAMLLAARPALGTWARVAAAIGVRPLGDGALVGALEALPRPALLLFRGRVLHANRAGRGLAGPVTEWARSRRPADFATTTPMRAGGMSLDLVLPCAPCRMPRALPPSLARVAELVGRGATDRTIAAQLDMPMSTVRTYVSRALSRLGCQDRRELIAASRYGGHAR